MFSVEVTRQAEWSPSLWAPKFKAEPEHEGRVFTYLHKTAFPWMVKCSRARFTFMIDLAVSGAFTLCFHANTTLKPTDRIH